MPIYEYRCESCDHQLEAIQKMSDKPLSQCPECQAPQLRKLMSATGGFKHKEKNAAGCGPSACGTGACPAMQG